MPEYGNQENDHLVIYFFYQAFQSFAFGYSDITTIYETEIF